MGKGEASRPPDELGPETVLLALLPDDDLGVPRDETIELKEDLETELLCTRLDDGRQGSQRLRVKPNS